MNTPDIKFVCPVSLEEFPLCDGILLDTKYYSLQSMRTWLRRKSTVPHTRREITIEERETILDGVEFSDDEFVYNEYSGDEDIYFADEDVYFADEDNHQLVNGSLPDETNITHTMSWSAFERFVKNARGYFDAKGIDSLTDAVFTVLGVEIHVNIRRQYLITSPSGRLDEPRETTAEPWTNEGDYSEKFTTHLSIHGYEFFQDEIADVHVGEAILESAHDYILQWYSLVFSLISSVL